MTPMRGMRPTLLAIGAAALSLAIVDGASPPATDRVARLNQALAQHERSLTRDRQTGYLVSVLDALGVPAESQLLVFSRTGVQRAYTSPLNPRALYMIYSDAFDGLPSSIKEAVFRRMLDVLSANDSHSTRAQVEDRRAVLEILRETRPDFPAQ